MPDTISLNRFQTDKTFKVKSHKKNSFNVKLNSHCSLIEMEDVHFHLNSCVLLPDYGPCDSSKDAEGKDHVTGLGVIIDCYKQIAKYPEQKVIITGHTDTSGEKDYNVFLSQLRSKNVLFLLTGDKNNWINVTLNKNKVEDYQQILKWVNVTRGWECDPGKVDDKKGPKTNKALLNFQKNYNKNFKTKIIENPNMLPDTWGAVFDVYILSIIELMKTDAEGLSNYQSSVQFIDNDNKAVGCGEYFPIENKYQDNYRSKKNRRVEILFFDKGEEPELKCHPNNHTCLYAKCQLNNKKYYKVTPIPCYPPGPIKPPKPAVKHEIKIVKVEKKYFVPKLEDIKIDYEIKGDLSKIKDFKFIVKSEKKENVTILNKKLTLPSNAQNSYNWNGEVNDINYDGFTNLINSPYLIQFILDLEDGTSTESNKEKIEIIPDSIEITIVDDSKNKFQIQFPEVIKELKTSIEKNTVGEVIYDSPLFKIKSSEMNDDSSFIEYRSKWKQGAAVPVLAKIWLKGKDDSKKRCSNVLKDCKLQWDVALNDDAEYEKRLNALGIHSEIHAFQKKISAYKKDNTQPNGRTSHIKFGGVRAKESERKEEKEPWSKLSNNWQIKKLNNRVWNSTSNCKTDSDLDFDTGVFFCGGRIAGDIHNITAYLDLKNELDDTDNKKLKSLNSSVKSNELSFQNSRRVYIVQNFKIGNETTELDIPALSKEYKKASMILERKPGLNVVDIQAQWKQYYKTEIQKQSKSIDFVKDAALEDPDLYPVKYRSYNDYWDRAHPNANIFGRIWHRIVSFFGAADEETYRNMCDKYAYPIYSNVVKNFPLNEDGLTFFKFGVDGDHNMWKHSFTAGIAPAIKGYTNRNKAVFFVFTEEKSTNTLIHEVGHLFFLAHAPGHFDSGDLRTTVDAEGNAVEQPAGFQPDAHDDKMWCVMSYHGSDPDKLCGLCLFKLEGWMYSEIHKDGSIG